MSDAQDAPREDRTGTCPECNGKGYVSLTWIREDPRRSCTCSRCRGSGTLNRNSEQQDDTAHNAADSRKAE